MALSERRRRALLSIVTGINLCDRGRYGDLKLLLAELNGKAGVYSLGVPAEIEQAKPAAFDELREHGCTAKDAISEGHKLGQRLREDN